MHGVTLPRWRAIAGAAGLHLAVLCVLLWPYAAQRAARTAPEHSVQVSLVSGVGRASDSAANRSAPLQDLFAQVRATDRPSPAAPIAPAQHASVDELLDQPGPPLGSGGANKPPSRASASAPRAATVSLGDCLRRSFASGRAVTVEVSVDAYGRAVGAPRIFGRSGETAGGDLEAAVRTAFEACAQSRLAATTDGRARYRIDLGGR